METRPPRGSGYGPIRMPVVRRAVGRVRSYASFRSDQPAKLLEQLVEVREPVPAARRNGLEPAGTSTGSKVRRPIETQDEGSFLRKKRDWAFVPVVGAVFVHDIR